MNWDELQRFKESAYSESNELAELILSGDSKLSSNGKVNETRTIAEESQLHGIASQLTQIPLPIQGGLASFGAKALQRVVFGKVKNPLLRFMITTGMTLVVTKLVAEIKNRLEDK